MTRQHDTGTTTGAPHEVPGLDPDLTDWVAPDRHRFRESGLWTSTRLAERVEGFAAKAPDREAVVDLGSARRTGFGALDRLANRLAHWMIEAGIEEGDVIAVQLPNCLEAAVVAIAANKLGVVVNPMLMVFRAKELRYMLGLARAKAIFVPPEYRGFSHRDLAEGVARELDHGVLSVIVDVPEPAAPESSAWLRMLAAYPETPCGRTPDASAVSVILFTSGTEADPKAVMHTEETLNANMRAVWAGLDMVEEKETVWMPSPVGHSTGFNFGIRYALLHGCTLVLQDRWSTEEAVALIQDERPTFTLAATVFLTDLLAAARGGPVDLSSIRIFGCGGAPIPPAVVMDAGERGMSVIRLYGQTEVLIATMNRPSSPLDKRIETDGPALDGMTVDIRDEDGRPLPRGSAGELWVQGASQCVGYYKDRERTRAKFERGWVRTGDLAKMDEDGYVMIVGRKSEIIIRGGMNITPREIEEEIARMEGVSAVAVVGLPDARLGEICCACVVAEDSATVTLETIVDRLRATGMATYKLPQRLEFVSELPRTASGKIQRHILVASLSSSPS
ncbi:MAG: AMP-binding protein [Rhodospirillaceae bacterium]|nr:AMP-binding protein [Rhodospirillaceae bacterium]